MYKSYEIKNCYRPKKQSRLCVGITEYNLKKYKYFRCGFKGSAAWENTARIPLELAKKYDKVRYKVKNKNEYFSVYVIPIDAIKEYNDKIEEKLKSFKNANITSHTYSQDHISEILKQNPIIREIAEFFGSAELEPYYEWRTKQKQIEKDRKKT